MMRLSIGKESEMTHTDLPSDLMDMDEDWGVVANALADAVIERRLPTKTILLGIHAFLMALHSTGHGDAGEICEELHQMADYYGSLVTKH